MSEFSDFEDEEGVEEPEMESGDEDGKEEEAVSKLNRPVQQTPGLLA